MENGIPNYLKPYISITKKPKDFNGEFSVTGNIKCTCGIENFIIKREKRMQSVESKEAEKKIQALLAKYKDKQNNGNLCITSRQEKDYIAHMDFKTGNECLLEDITELKKIAYDGQLIPTLFEAVCPRCRQNIMIFDSREHGYDGIIAELKNNYAKDFTTIKKSKCRKCGSETSKITVTLSSTGKDDLFAVSCDLINESNWEDAYDWITIDLECADCGNKTKKYLDLETM